MRHDGRPTCPTRADAGVGRPSAPASGVRLQHKTIPTAKMKRAGLRGPRARGTLGVGLARVRPAQGLDQGREAREEIARRTGIGPGGGKVSAGDGALLGGPRAVSRVRRSTGLEAVNFRDPLADFLRKAIHDPAV